MVRQHVSKKSPNIRICRGLAVFLSIICFTLVSPIPRNGLAEQPNTHGSTDELRVMAWNIWRGGREDGKEIGPQRVIDVIKQSSADIVAMQETYGSGELIAAGLGFHFHPRGTNVSIHSRYPVLEDISVFEEFKCAGALIDLPGKRRVAFYSIWLPYGEDIWLENSRDELPIERMLAACQPSAEDLVAMLAAIDKRLDDPKYDDVLTIIAGDFNSMSHLDYREIAKDQFQQVINWPTSRLMFEDGFRDSYREANPEINRAADATWSPRFAEQEQDRIDFIYYKSDRWRTNDSKVIQTHPEKFPSDHAAVVTTLKLNEPSPETSGVSLSAVTYNIKHGHGMDGKVDLSRSAKVLKDANADLIGLQEIDLNANRSGQVNQAEVLGKGLGMHAAFGKFMEYDGGRYGMAILSRYPFCNVQQLRLPTGNEPRVALVAEVILPNDERLAFINVHFDWVRDDKFRLSQAKVVQDYIAQLDIPHILVGDFNDVPGSATLQLFDLSMLEADKPEGKSFTIPSDKPNKELDYVFVGPDSRWHVESCQVIDEPVASDHCPFSSRLLLKSK